MDHSPAIELQVRLLLFGAFSFKQRKSTYPHYKRKSIKNLVKTVNFLQISLKRDF